MFTFDSVYDWNSNQDDLYENTVKPLVYSVLDGYNGTIFAYGQTGTGKTYTMLGSQHSPRHGQQQQVLERDQLRELRDFRRGLRLRLSLFQGQGAREKGISSKCFEDIFRHIAYTSDRTMYVVRASYFEIYQVTRTCPYQIHNSLCVCGDGTSRALRSLPRRRRAIC